MHTENLECTRSTMPISNRLISFSNGVTMDISKGSEYIPASSSNNDDNVSNFQNQSPVKSTAINAGISQLEALRNDCDANDLAKHSEIRNLEIKLAQLICEQTVARKKIPDWRQNEELHKYPLLIDWLKIVGFDDKCIEIITDYFKYVDDLIEADIEELTALFLKGFYLDNFNTNSDKSDKESSEKSNSPSRLLMNFKNKYDDDVRKDVISYVYDCLQRLLKANRSLSILVDATLRNDRLQSPTNLSWDSWRHWAKEVEPSMVGKVQAAIIEARRRPTKFTPKPLPPLPELPRASRLSNCQMSGDSNNNNGNNANSKSNGNSPISPPPPPLSAGYNYHRTVLSTSSSSFPSICNSNSTTCSEITTSGNASASTAATNQATCRLTPPLTPISHHKRSSIFSRNVDTTRKPTTPPPSLRHQTNLFSNDDSSEQSDPFPPTNPITKSKSHEEHLSNRIEPIDNLIFPKFFKKCNLGLFSSKSKSSNTKQHNSIDNLPCAPHHRRRLATEPGSAGSTSPILTSSNCTSPVPSPFKAAQYAQYKATMSDLFLDMIPRSPRSTFTMLHSIQHRFTGIIRISPNHSCNVCDRSVWFGYKCRDCKFYCHWDCMVKAPPSCGLPTELFNIFKHNMDNSISNPNPQSYSPSATYKNLTSNFASTNISASNFVSSFANRAKSQLANYPASAFVYDSTPSSPSLFSNITSSSPGNSKINSQFQFPPDINVSSSGALSSETENATDYTSLESNNAVNYENERVNHLIIQTENDREVEDDEGAAKTNIDSEKSAGSLVTSGSSGDSMRTVTGRLNSQDSQASDIDPNDRAWARHNSLISREWDIPYEDIKIGKLIGKGRFGTVYQGNWHGDVAIKKLNAQNNNDDDRKAVESFKQEIAVLRKTRHDNLVLFMGVCTQRSHLAIVTSLCKGRTLHHLIHLEPENMFTVTKALRVAEQICQGMSYLHGRSVVHKDLKTKNVFFDSGRVTITDFGLSSVAKLCDTNRRGDRLTVPKGWLCYLAPEIIRTLNINSWESDDLPFSFSTDVYAFGTVMYELLYSRWPFAGQPSEVIIWQVGRGIKQSINSFHQQQLQQVPKEIKDLLAICWSFDERDRPDFIKTLPELLQKMPKKRLQRSPSHPAHLQHTSEQKF